MISAPKPSIRTCGSWVALRHYCDAAGGWIFSRFRSDVLVCIIFLFVVGFAAPAQQPQLVVQTGHARGVTSIAFSPDGKVIASGSGDATLKLWDAASGKQLRSLPGVTTGVFSVAFSPDGMVIAGSSYDGWIKIWDAATGRHVRTLTGHAGPVWAIAFSPDGKMLASAGDDHTIKLWDTATGKEMRSVAGHGGAVTSVAFSRDGKSIASGSEDKTIKLWDAATGKQMGALTGHTDSVRSVAFSPDGKVIASGSADKTIRLWDNATGNQLRSLAGHTKTVTSVAFSRDGNMIASGSADLTIRLWDAAAGTELRSLESPQPHYVYSVVFSPNGKLIASGGLTIDLWESATGNPVRSFASHSSVVNSVAFSSDGKVIAAGNYDATIKLWDAVTGKQLSTLEGHTALIQAVAFSPDSKVIASGSADKTLKLWDAATGKQLRSFIGHTDEVSSIAFRPDGKVIASGSYDKTIKLWEAATGKLLRTLELQPGSPEASLNNVVWSIAFSPDGKMIASGFNDASIRLSDAATGEQRRPLVGHASAVASVAFSPDGKAIASGSTEGEIKLWDAATGQQLHSLAGHSKWVASVAFSPDGNFIVSGSWDNMIRLWDVATGRQLRSFEDHAAVLSIAFSPEGRFISGGADATIKVWRTDRDKPLATLISLDKDDWVVVTPDDRFDTNNLEKIEGLHWVMPDAPFTPLPLEIFMRDYYEPQLLPRLLKCNEQDNCYREFKPIRDISTLNRVQPPVKISNVSLPDAEGYVNVTVEVGKGEATYLVNDTESIRKTGVYDLRLFRDGQMVGRWPSEGARKLLQTPSKDLALLTGEQRLLRDLKDWQQATEVKPEGIVKIDQKTGVMTLPPFRVKLPRSKDASQIEFSAYGFNEDRIKSQTAKWEWPADVIAKLPKAQPVKPRAYVIAVGVNAYENADFDLSFAADDARRMSQVISAQLKAGGQYEQVVPVTLVSDYETRNCQKMPTVKQATKENFRTVLELLAGNNTNRKLLEGVPNADQIQKATPDDLVLIMYSSHGYADRSGNFYFIPYNTGPGKGKVFTETVRQHSISSEELSLWLRAVDAGEMVMIVDACHSTAAIAGQDFKPGPMGSRGLGQLSYDKGMRILTATQSDNVAWEYPTLKQGVLTYALLRDGIEARQADHNKDNTITLAEWLAYGVDRVPKLYQEVLTNSVQTFGVKPEAQPTLTLTAKECGRVAGRKELEEVLVEQDNKSRATQQPSLFDFTRKKREVVLSRSPPASP